MRFKEHWLQFISVFVLIRNPPCFNLCVELMDCKITCVVVSMMKNVIFADSLLMYHQHQLILIFIKLLDSFEGLMAIIIFTALAGIDVCRHNSVSRFINNLSELYHEAWWGGLTSSNFHIFFFCKIILNIYAVLIGIVLSGCLIKANRSRTLSIIPMFRSQGYILFYELLWYSKSVSLQ